MRIVLFGAGGKVGRVLGPALVDAGHDLVTELNACDVVVDFTSPAVVDSNLRACIAHRVPVVVGTTGWDVGPIDVLAKEAGVPVFFGPNFSIGAVLMMRLATEAATWLPANHIVEMHDVAKRDSPSGTAIATAAAMGTEPTISSVRLPGLVAHQEVIFGSAGEVLTIRHDTTSREAFIPGVLLALARIAELPAGVTTGLETILSGPADA